MTGRVRPRTRIAEVPLGSCLRTRSGRIEEAPGGFEPPNGGFADLCLTTWLRGHHETRGVIERPARFPDGKRATGLEPATFCMASRRSTN